MVWTDRVKTQIFRTKRGKGDMSGVGADMAETPDQSGGDNKFGDTALVHRIDLSPLPIQQRVGLCVSF